MITAKLFFLAHSSLLLLLSNLRCYCVGFAPLTSALLFFDPFVIGVVCTVGACESILVSQAVVWWLNGVRSCTLEERISHIETLTSLAD